MVEERPRIATDADLQEAYSEQAPIRQRAMFGDKPKERGFTDTPPSMVSTLGVNSMKAIARYKKTLDKDDKVRITNAKLNQLRQAIVKFAESNQPFPYEDFENLFTEEIIDRIIIVEIINMGDSLYEIDKIIESSEITSREYIPEEDNPLYGRQTMTETYYETYEGRFDPQLVQRPTSESRPVMDEVITAKIYPRKDKAIQRKFSVNAKEPTVSSNEVALTRANLSNDNILTTAYKQMARTFGLGFSRKENLMPSVMKAMYNRMAQLKAKKRELVTGPEFTSKFQQTINNKIMPLLERGYQVQTYEGVIAKIARDDKRFFAKEDIKEMFAYFLIFKDYENVSEEGKKMVNDILNQRFALGDQQQTLRRILLDIYREFSFGTLGKLNEEAREVQRYIQSGRLRLSMDFLKADISSLDEDRRREIKTILQNSHPTEYFGEDYLKLGKLINILGDVADTDEETLLEELGVENLQMVKKAAALRKIYERLYRTLRDIVYEEE